MTRVTVEHVDGLRFLATVGGHAAVVDAAPEDGGGGTALSGPQMFVTAVGACVLEFVVNSCRLRGIPCERVGLELEYEELSRPRRIGPLHLALYIEPEPGEAEKRRLLGVARHATLVNTIVRPPAVEVGWGANSERGGDSGV